MKNILVTGTAGLVGSEAARYFSAREFRIIGIENDMRAAFFGNEASVRDTLESLKSELGPQFVHFERDIRDYDAVASIVEQWGPDLLGIIHTAAQPSHDWAARDPHTDFGVNAVGTLNLLEAARRHCPKAAFIFTSTNKVYGDRPNEWNYEGRFATGHDAELRFDRYLDDPNSYCYSTDAPLSAGFDESLSIDQTKHSLFGASKLAADILVQEYGRYFGMNTVCFRAGCLTGPAHQGTKLHGFLSYLVRCAMTGEPYTVIGYKGKQVRDNLHSADLVAAFDEYLKAPQPGAVYNIGGGRANSCSVREAIKLVEEVSGKPIDVRYEDEPRIGDHKWWITDTRKFRADYPNWSVRIGLREIVEQIVEAHSGA